MQSTIYDAKYDHLFVISNSLLMHAQTVTLGNLEFQRSLRTSVLKQ